MELSDRFAEAFQWAETLHRDQMRKGTGIPYIAHLMAVAGITLEHGGGEDEAIAALLHDAIEDQAAKAGGADAMREEIRSRFGSYVLEIVEACTDASTIPKPPWRARKERYLAHLPEAPPGALLVSASDKLHNARSILLDLRELGDDLWDRFNGGREGSLWYYRSLAAAYREAGAPDRLTGEFERTVSEIEALAAEAEGASEGAS